MLFFLKDAAERMLAENERQNYERRENTKVKASSRFDRHGYWEGRCHFCGRVQDFTAADYGDLDTAKKNCETWKQRHRCGHPTARMRFLKRAPHV